MAGRRWEGAKSFEQLSEAERDQVRQELGVRRMVPQPARASNPRLSAPVVSNYLDFTETTTPSAPAANIARMWAETANGVTVMHWKSSLGVDHQMGRDLLALVRNTSGGTLNKGDAVYISGATGNIPTVAKARANSATTMPGFGIVVANISNNGFGQVCFAGDINGLDTSGFSEGATLYIDASTAGTLTATAPTGTNIPQAIGIVARSHATQGIIYVTIGAELDPALTQTLSNKTPASPVITGLSDYADDAAAAAGGVVVGGLYRTASVLKIRVS